MEKYHGIATYTYYFRLPKTSTEKNIYAYIWNSKALSNGSESINPWPGLPMEQVSDYVYKIQVTKNMAHYKDFDSIIFNNGNNGNEGGIQTVDIKLDRNANNNQVYSLSEYDTPGKQRLMVYGGELKNGRCYAYLWNDNNDVLAEWPGIDITDNVVADATWYVEFDAKKYTKIIFNAGQGNAQTQDLTIPNGSDWTCDFSQARSQQDMSVWSKNHRYGSWSDYITPETLEPSHSHD